MTIIAIEDGIIARVQAVLGNKVRAVESLPATWDDVVLKRVLRSIPGVFVAFAGGNDPSASQGAVVPSLDSMWSVAVATNHASGEKARRRGDSTAVGAYELVEILVPALHRYKIPGVGSLMFVRIENLFDDEIDKQGVMVYAIVFRIAMSFAEAVDPSALNPFQTFTTAIDVPPDTPKLIDTVVFPD